jgi:uncharacterized protein (UPF0216 family)
LKGKFDDKVLAKMVRALNRDLCVERKTLLTLLSEEKPAVRAGNDSMYRIKREELELIAKLVPKEDYGKVRLPILIELTPDYGRGFARVRGRLDCQVVRRILEREEESSDEIFIHRADIMKLRHELRTTTQYAFLYRTSF